jgi:hypothetical protein
MFRHPKYYKELRKLRNNSDQAISKLDTREVVDSVRPGPGLKPQANEELEGLKKYVREKKKSI